MNKIRFKSYHLIIIPYDKTRGKSVLFTGRILKLITFVSIILLVTFATLVTLHIKNFRKLQTSFFPTLKRNSFLTNENSRLMDVEDSLRSVMDSLTTQLLSERTFYRERLGSLNWQVKSLVKFAEDLRIMAGFKLEPKEAQPPGLGGPLPEDENDNFLLTKDVEKVGFPLAFNGTERLLYSKVSSAKEKLESLWNFFEDKSSIIEGTPELQPVPGNILSGFGYRINPFTGGVEFHKGVDIPAAIGTKVKAPADGVITFIGIKGGYGKVIKIDHGNHYMTVYGHLHSFDVKVGDRVKKGDFIGEVGDSGMSTGSHLHYEVRLNNIPVNPVTYFKSVKEREGEFGAKKNGE